MFSITARATTFRTVPLWHGCAYLDDRSNQEEESNNGRCAVSRERARNVRHALVRDNRKSVNDLDVRSSSVPVALDDEL